MVAVATFLLVRPTPKWVSPNLERSSMTLLAMPVFIFPSLARYAGGSLRRTRFFSASPTLTSSTESFMKAL